VVELAIAVDALLDYLIIELLITQSESDCTVCWTLIILRSRADHPSEAIVCWVLNTAV
jgi:hypothetical protein